MYGEGISFEGDLLDLGVEHNVVEKSGAWYAFETERIGQGRENAKQFLKENTDVTERIKRRLLQGAGLLEGDAGGEPAAAAAATEEASAKDSAPKGNGKSARSRKK
jgi:recombination protein RecA